MPRGRHHRPRRIAATLAVLMTLGMASMASAQAEPKVRVGPNPAGLEELITLEIEVPGDGSGRMVDANFRLDNLRQVAGPAVSTSFSIVNGRSSSSRTLSWQFQPLAEGNARVHAIQVLLGDQTIDVGAQQIVIEKEIPAGRQRRSAARRNPFGGRVDDDPFERLFRPRRQVRQAEPRIFLRAEVTPKRPWVGQQVLYTLYLFTQADIESVTPDELPDWQGFWSRELPEPKNRRSPVERVEHEGEVFGRVRLLRRALFPRREGVLEIEPMQISLRARLPDDSPFGMLSARRVDIERTSNAVTVDVKPLPPPPPGYTGVVGDLSFEGSLEPAELETGDAATLTLELEGRGNLQGALEPNLPTLDGIKIFPPQRQSNERIRGNRVFGSRTWQYVLVPERPGTWSLPPITVPYFDPDAGRYEQATVEGLSLVARGATALAQEDGATVRLHPIRTAALPSAARGNGFASFVPWLFATPFLLGLLVIGLRARTGSGAANEKRTLLAALEAAGREDDPRRVATQVEDAWRAYLEHRFDIAPGVPSTQWQRALEAKGVSAERAQALVTLADDVHYLRYAPKLSSTDDLRRELIERSRKLVRGL